MKVDFVKKLRKESAYLVTGTSDIGIACYFYVDVPAEKVKAFLSHPAGTPCNLDDYGTVIEKGYGEPED